jgi:hypothetical protein
MFLNVRDDNFLLKYLKIHNTYYKGIVCNYMIIMVKIYIKMVL